ERKIGADRIKVLRVKRESRLETLQSVKGEKAHKGEGKHCKAIAFPVLLFIFPDAAQQINAPLERPQHRRQKRALAIEDARHVKPKGLYNKREDHAVKGNLNESVCCHCVDSSKTLWPNQGNDEIDEQAKRRGCAQDVFEDHG